MVGIHHHGIVLTSVAALRFLCPKGPFLVWLLGAYEDERRGGVGKTLPAGADVISGASVGICSAEPMPLCSWELPGLAGII